MRAVISDGDDRFGRKEPPRKSWRSPYVQEVVANSIALKAMYGEIGTAIELGGQDAKIIFSRGMKRTGERRSRGYADEQKLCLAVQVRLWMRIASLLKHRLREFDALAAQGTTGI